MVPSEFFEGNVLDEPELVALKDRKGKKE